MILALEVSGAAAIGAVLRYVVDQIIQHQHDMSFPWGTFAINLSGSFLLGLVTGLGLHHGLGSSTVAILGTGICGGYTTWSTYCWESLAIAETGLLGVAAANVFVSLVAGFAAAAAGLGLALL